MARNTKNPPGQTDMDRDLEEIFLGESLLSPVSPGEEHVDPTDPKNWLRNDGIPHGDKSIHLPGEERHGWRRVTVGDVVQVQGELQAVIVDKRDEGERNKCGLRFVNPLPPKRIGPQDMEVPERVTRIWYEYDRKGNVIKGSDGNPTEITRAEYFIDHITGKLYEDEEHRVPALHLDEKGNEVEDHNGKKKQARYGITPGDMVRDVAHIVTERGVPYYRFNMRHDCTVYIGGEIGWTHVKPEPRQFLSDDPDSPDYHTPNPEYRPDGSYTPTDRILFDLYRQGVGQPGYTRILLGPGNHHIYRTVDGTAGCCEIVADHTSRIKFHPQIEIAREGGVDPEIIPANSRRQHIIAEGGAGVVRAKKGTLSINVEEVFDPELEERINGEIRKGAFRPMRRWDVVRFVYPNGKPILIRVTGNPTADKTMGKRKNEPGVTTEQATPYLLAVHDANLAWDGTSGQFFADREKGWFDRALRLLVSAPTCKILGISQRKTMRDARKLSLVGETVDTGIPEGRETDPLYLATRESAKYDWERQGERSNREQVFRGKTIRYQEGSRIRGGWDAEQGMLFLAVGTALGGLCALVAGFIVGRLTNSEAAGYAAGAVAGTLGLGAMQFHTDRFITQEDREFHSKSVKDMEALEVSVVGLNFFRNTLTVYKNAAIRAADGLGGAIYVAGGGKKNLWVSSLLATTAAVGGFAAAPGIITGVIGTALLGLVALAWQRGESATRGYVEEYRQGKPGKNIALKRDENRGVLGRLPEP